MRLRTLLGTAAVVSLALLATATPAAAATTDLTVNAPEKVSVGASYVSIPWTVTGTTFAMDNFIGMVNVQRTGVTDDVAEDVAYAHLARRTGRLWIAAKDVMPGSYTVGWEGASDVTTDADFTTTADAIVVKFSGRAGLTATRSGKTVTLTGSATRFSKYNKWMATQPTITFQRYINGAWRTIKTVMPNTKGHAVLTVTDATARSYRVLQNESKMAWADYSSTVKK